jgi:hypothetical protein
MLSKGTEMILLANSVLRENRRGDWAGLGTSSCCGSFCLTELADPDGVALS